MSGFKIDKPGVYRLRNGKRVYVWPLLISRQFWSSEEDDSQTSELHRTDGRVVENRETSYDIVEYIGRLPENLLQRMRDALAQAEEAQQ
jgi:hypothetical protein